MIDAAYPRRWDLNLSSQNLLIGGIGCLFQLTSNNRRPLDFIDFFQKKSPSIFELIGPLYSKGLSITDISKETGLSRGVIWKTFRTHRQELRSQSPVPFTRWRQGRGKTKARPPFGLCFFEGQIIKDPREYPTLLLIQNLCKRGATISSIVRELDRRKIRTRMNKPWSYNVIKAIIKRCSDGSLGKLLNSNNSRQTKTKDVSHESR